MADLARRLWLADHALETLKQLLPEPLTPIVRDALVQRFEYTFEAKLAKNHDRGPYGRRLAVNSWAAGPNTGGRPFSDW